MNKPAEPSPEVAPMQTGVCAHCGNPIRVFPTSGVWVHTYDNGRFCAGQLDMKGTQAVPAVAPRETQRVTPEHVEGMATEIGASRVMAPKNDADRAWNAACERAMRIVRRYKTGKGLFQP